MGRSTAKDAANVVLALPLERVVSGDSTIAGLGRGVTHPLVANFDGNQPTLAHANG
jgi:hypothetical protein